MNKQKMFNGNKRKISAAAILAAALAAIWLALEILVFVIALPNSPQINGDDFCLTDKGENGYIVDRDRTLYFSADCGAVQTVSFVAYGEGTGVLNMTVKGYDPSNSANILTYAKESFAIENNKETKSVVIQMDIPANAGEFLITFEHDGFDYSVDKIIFNERGAVNFNFARLLMVWAIILIFALLKYFDLWRVYFDPNKKEHAASALALCLVSVLIAVLLSGTLCPDREEVAYPFEATLNYYNPYEQQFDAFMKGQLHIDFEPSEELKALENPYDPASRDGVYYLWDRAYYEGYYYSYFGIAPILTVYYPYYLINGALPADDTVSSAFAIMTALFFSMAAVKLAAMYTKKLPLPILWIGTLGALFSTQIFLIMRGHSRFYYIAIAAGMAFLSMFIWLFLCGISGSLRLSTQNDKGIAWRRPLIFVFAGAAFGLCFLSRYNMALLAAFAIVPMLWFSVVKERKDGKCKFRSLKRIIPELVALGAPVVIALGAQLVMNHLRFDSILEFGTTYQLTVSDVSQNKIRLADLPYAIFHYFLQPLSFWSDFPFVSLYYTKLQSYGHYVYVDTGMGLLSIPFMWSLLGSVWLFRDKNQSARRKTVVGAILLGALVVSLLDFCLGGVIYRYTCDLTLICAVLGLYIVYAISERASETGSEVKTNTAVTVLVVLTIFVSMSLAFSLNANLTDYSPSAYIAFRDFFSN